MAIINTKRVTVVGLKEDQSQILKTLQSLGAVQVAENTFEAADSITTTNDISRSEQNLADIAFALDLLSPYNTEKTSLLTVKPAIDKKGLEAFKALERKELIVLESLKEFSEELSWARANISRAENLIAQVKPYRHFDDTFEALGMYTYTYATLGALPAEEKETFISQIEALSVPTYYEIIDEDHETAIVFAVAHLTILSEFKEVLKNLGFAEVKYEHFDDSPTAIIRTQKEEIKDLRTKKAEIKAQIASFADHIPALKSLEDYYSALLQREKAALSFGYTQNAFVLEGWIDEANEDEVEKAITEVSEEAVVTFRFPLEGESYPTIIENPKLARPFEAITSMYDTPNARGIDPNLVMAPFFVIAFGMMVSDAGYGIILAILCTLALWKMKPVGMMGKILGVVAVGGVSTLIWGTLFGGWFGIEGVKALWFNPMEDPLMMMGLCLGIGTFQIIFGLGVAAVMNIKRGKPWAALFDQVSWILILLGLPSLLLGEGFAVAGKFMALTGAGLLLLFAGREKKGVIGKVLGGLGSLYGITGYLSDILSYSRIFGMGLATGVIAMVFNTIASMFFGKWFLIPIGVIILAVGHSFNIGINTLGAYVHACRLQYIEYYGKFFEGGGKPFRPLKTDIKHYRFEKNI